MSLLATIRAAVRPVADVITDLDDDPNEENVTSQPLQTGAEPKEGAMPNENTAPGADVKPGISEAAHTAAVTKANADGKVEGAKAANDRMVAILGAEGIKGDGKRMGAALDLSVKSPDMAAADVVAFVSDNVAAAATSTTPAPKGGSYEQQRLAAAQLVQPNGGASVADNANKQVLADAVARTNKRNRR
jgi:hypothetical protein